MINSIQALRSGAGMRTSARLVMIGLACAALLVAYLLFGGADFDPKLGIALTVLVLLAPSFVYVVFKRPVILFAIYAFSVPLQNLVHVDAIGTLSKGLGGLAAILLVFALYVRRKAVPFDRAVYAWAAFLLWTALSFFWSIDPEYHFVNLSQLVNLFVLYAIVSVVPMSAIDLRIVVIATTLGGIYGGLYSLNQYLHNGIHSGAWTRLYIKDGENDIDANHFAAAMQLPIALALMAALTAKKILPRLVLLGALGSMFVAVFLGASRGGLVAILIMCIFFAIRTGKFRQMMMVLVIAGIASLAFPSVWARFNDPSQGEGSGRLPIWRVGFYAFQTHWLAGVGSENFQYAYDKYFVHVYQDEFQGWSRPSHNILLGTATELGIIGLGLLLFAGTAQFQSLRVIRRGTPFFAVRIALEGAFLGLLTESMFIDTLWYKYVWLLFALMGCCRSAYLTTYGFSEKASLRYDQSEHTIPALPIT